MSLQERFETLSQVRDTFGLLLDFQKVHRITKSKSALLSITSHVDIQSNREDVSHGEQM